MFLVTNEVLRRAPSNQRLRQQPTIFEKGITALRFNQLRRGVTRILDLWLFNFRKFAEPMKENREMSGIYKVTHLSLLIQNWLVASGYFWANINQLTMFFMQPGETPLPYLNGQHKVEQILFHPGPSIILPPTHFPNIISNQFLYSSKGFNIRATTVITR